MKAYRSITVDGFRWYVVLYVAERRTVTIMRVLHGARDIEAILVAGDPSN